MAKRLTKKQRGFVKDYLATGNGTQAVLANYDTTDPNTASSIATENLQKLEIAITIEEALKDDILAAKHQQLLNATHLERLNFDYYSTDADIEGIVAKMPGYELLHIVRRATSDGSSYESVYAYVKAPDNMTQDKALDKAYKIKGTYAPEKKLVGTIDLNNDHRERSRKAIREVLD